MRRERSCCSVRESKIFVVIGGGIDVCELMGRGMGDDDEGWDGRRRNGWKFGWMGGCGGDG